MIPTYVCDICRTPLVKSAADVPQRDRKRSSDDVTPSLGVAIKHYNWELEAPELWSTARNHFCRYCISKAAELNLVLISLELPAATEQPA
jgi:hypothetical protein